MFRIATFLTGLTLTTLLPLPGSALGEEPPSSLGPPKYTVYAYTATYNVRLPLILASDDLFAVSAAYQKALPEMKKRQARIVIEVGVAESWKTLHPPRCYEVHVRGCKSWQRLATTETKEEAEKLASEAAPNA